MIRIIANRPNNSVKVRLMGNPDYTLYHFDNAYVFYDNSLMVTIMSSKNPDEHGAQRRLLVTSLNNAIIEFI